MRQKIEDIQTKLTEAQTIFNTLTIKEQEKTTEMFSEKHSLAHCLRWGEIACDEILEETL